MQSSPQQIATSKFTGHLYHCITHARLYKALRYTFTFAQICVCECINVSCMHNMCVVMRHVNVYVLLTSI